MQTVSDAYTAAVSAKTRVPRRRVLVAWGGDPTADTPAPGDELGDISRYVVNGNLDSSLTTDLPEETRLVTGYASTKLTLTLSGDPRDGTRHGAWLWSPFNTASPYYGIGRIGSKVVVQLGVETDDGPEYVTVFTGQITKLQATVGSAGRTATLEALDGAERLRGRVDLPMVVGYDLSSDQQGGLNSQWVIDRILRSGGFCAGPPTRPTAFFSVTLHGSFAPEIGASQFVFHEVDGGSGLLDDPGEVPYAQGQWGLAPTTDHALYAAGYDTPLTDVPVSGGSLVVSGWMFVPSERLSVGAFGGDPEVGWTAFAGDDNYFVRLQLDDSNTATLAVNLTRAALADADVPGVTVPPGWHYVGVQIVFLDATHVMTRYRVDGVTTVVSSTVVPVASANGARFDGANVSGLSPAESVQFFIDGASEPDWDDDFTPTAILDPGLAQLVAPPTATADNAWAMVQQVVAAEYGTLRFDGAGRAVFWNRQHWRKSVTANTVQRTITTAESILDMSSVELADQIRNRITVPYQPVSVSAPTILWQVAEAVMVPARGAVTRWAGLGSDSAWNVDTTGWVYPAGGPLGPDGGGKSGYRAARNKDGSGGQVNNLAMTITPFTDRILIEVANPNAFDAWLVSPHGGTSPNGGGTYPTDSDGDPAVVIVGQRISSTVTAPDSDTVDPSLPTGSFAEATLPGLAPGDERVFTASPSPWRQSGDAAQGVADDLLRALYRPMPQIQGLSIVADPAIELGDRLQVQDPDGLALDDPFWVAGLNLRFDSAGMTESLTLRPVGAPGQFIFGVTGRDVLNETPL